MRARWLGTVVAAGGHAWLHRACWPAMNAAREREARAAIKAAFEVARDFDAAQETLEIGAKIKSEG